MMGCAQLDMRPELEYKIGRGAEIMLRNEEDYLRMWGMKAGVKKSTNIAILIKDQVSISYVPLGGQLLHLFQCKNALIKANEKKPRTAKKTGDNNVDDAGDDLDVRAIFKILDKKQRTCEMDSCKEKRCIIDKYGGHVMLSNNKLNSWATEIVSRSHNRRSSANMVNSFTTVRASIITFPRIPPISKHSMAIWAANNHCLTEEENPKLPPLPPLPLLPLQWRVSSCG
jgi:hypothetical protein